MKAKTIVNYLLATPEDYDFFKPYTLGEMGKIWFDNGKIVQIGEKGSDAMDIASFAEFSLETRAEVETGKELKKIREMCSSLATNEHLRAQVNNLLLDELADLTMFINADSMIFINDDDE